MSLSRVARETLDLLEAGTYLAPSGAEVSIADAQARAIEGARLYPPAELEGMLGGVGAGGAAPSIAVTDETAQVAAHRLVREEGVEDLALLNFASARNHGGGFLGGAKAQEEDLCRCSGLYPSLLLERVQPYYRVNRAAPSTLYTDHMIYTPGVPWFRTRSTGELLEAPFLAAVITAPAPNAGALRRNAEGLAAIRDTFARRWRMVLAIAEANAHRALVLGAWGCGAFQNDAAVAAATLAEALADPRFAGALDRVTLAIPNRGHRGARNHAAFARAFAR